MRKSKKQRVKGFSIYFLLFVYSCFNINMLDSYDKYLETIDSYLAKFFEQQKPYIFCKSGCSICCEEGTYPFSKLEFDYLMFGYEKLPSAVKIQIDSNINRIKEEKKKSADKNFLYTCPFLIDNECSVYQYRGLICRSYGLMSFYTDTNGERKCHIPCCVSHGLNYSNVYDEETGIFTTEKWLKSGIEIEPVSYNISLNYLLDNDLTKFLDLEFGSQKALIDWFD